MLVNLIRTLCLLFLLAACTSAPHKAGLVYADFPETHELKGEAIPLDTALFRYPFRIRVQAVSYTHLRAHETSV